MSAIAVGFPESPSASIELVPRANLRIKGANSGVAVATVTGTFVLAAAVCASGVGATCIIAGIVAVLQGWVFTFLVEGSTTTTRRSLPGPEYEFTVEVGRGARQLDKHLQTLVHPDVFSQGWYQDLLEDMRNKEPHYMTLSRDSSGRSSSMWFINETSHPGMAEREKRDTESTTVTKIYYTWDKEGSVRFQDFDKRSAQINAIGTAVGDFCAKQFRNGYCLGFDDDDAPHPLVNNGELYFNQQGGIAGACNKQNQGVFKL